MLEIGTVVKTPNGEIGWVRSEPSLTPVGEIVHVEFLPAFTHTTASGWSDYKVTDLAEATVCGCATLGYRDRAGVLHHTGCDVTRTPGKGRKFLPGHDAKAKGFLIRAWGNAKGNMMGGHEHALDAARQFGDKITMKVAEGISREQRRFAESITARIGEDPATRAVMRNLQKSDGQKNSHEPIGYSFGTDLETFTKNAKAWLGDKTELRSSTIEKADYSVAYEHFVIDAD
jgi:hypothetical protein